MTMRTIMLLVLFVILTWGGSAAIAYGVVELTGGGPQGEQGEQGKRGLTGPAGTSGDFDLFRTSGLERLAEMWASTQTRESTQHPQTRACVDHIMRGTGSGADCGFTLVE